MSYLRELEASLDLDSSHEASTFCVMLFAEEVVPTSSNSWEVFFKGDSWAAEN